MKEVAGPGLEQTGHAIITAAQSLISAKNVQSLFVNNKTRNEKIKLAVVVIVEPDGASGPSGSSDTSLVSHIGERPITVVVIKQIASVTRDVQINPSIAIVIAGCDAHAESSAGHSCLVRHIRECA